MVQSPENPNSQPLFFTPENLDPATAFDQVYYDPALLEQAGGDSEYLRFLREERLANLRVAINPTPEEYDKLLRKRDALAAYERYRRQ